MKRVVTKSDVGKKFKEVIEGRIVTLEQVRDDGWFDAVADNVKVILPPNSLRRLEDNELLNQILDESKTSDNLHIRKVEKITIIGKNSNGDKIEQVLEGEDAELWHDYVRGLSLITYLIDKINFDFAHLKWKKKITKKT